MKILIINFNLKGLEVDAFKAQAHIDAMDFRSVEGLISKYFIGDENDNVYGGVYIFKDEDSLCLLYTSPSQRDATLSRMPSSA